MKSYSNSTANLGGAPQIFLLPSIWTFSAHANKEKRDLRYDVQTDTGDRVAFPRLYLLGCFNT